MSRIVGSDFRVKNRLGTSGRSGSGEKQLRVADLSAKVPSELKKLTLANPYGVPVCTEKDHNFLPPIVNLIISRRLDHQRLKLLDAFRAPVAGGSSPDEHDDAADDNSYGGGYNHGGSTILDEHGAQSGGDGLVSGGVRHVGDDD
ncbi:hypothetical protein F2Q70_00030974 [Brassica cretica]|uniref:Uncharacterized protein n=1 Tax=Brassica cretica TaxID=69181 RepID=A0A8S9FH68_BRACR|nr:hypothetical protein F2Q70_00030974 [Brassica cretica]